MDTKGANTFPLYKVPPEPKNLKLRSFLFFSTFPYWIKEKSVATLAIRDICFPKQKHIKVSSPYDRTGDSAGELQREVTLKKSFMLSNCSFF